MKLHTMKKLHTAFSTLCLLALLAGCGGAEANKTAGNTAATTSTTQPPAPAPAPAPAPQTGSFSLKGKITGATSDKVFFDRRMPDAHDVIASVPLNADGSFEIRAALPEAGIYRLRVGLAAMPLILEGTETMEISAEIKGENLLSMSVQNAPLSAELPKWQDTKKVSEKAIVDFLKTNDGSANPFLHYYLVERLPMDKNLPAYEAVLVLLTKKYPNSPLTLALNAKVSTLAAAKNAQAIDVGVQAPDIRLSDPNGKEISLSSLKGKLVLLDFWASWCGPCRRENPNVVNIYKQYKDKGFTVYSVSLDGLDNNTMMRMQGNPADIDRAREAQRRKWTDAIKQDGLEWTNHVSDLRGWSSTAAALYGVNSIPRTFLIDKSGKIIGKDLRGDQLAQQVKAALK